MKKKSSSVLVDPPTTPNSEKRGCSICPAQIACAFAGISMKTRSDFRTLCENRVYGRATVLFRQGDEVRGLFVVRSGWVKLGFAAPNGHAAIVGLIGPGSLLGLREVVTGQSHSVSAETVESSELDYVNRAGFVAFLEERPEVAVALLTRLSHEAGRLLRELCEVATRVPPADRLLHTLQDLAASCGLWSEEGARLRLSLTVQELAERIGCSRQWTTRALDQLQTRGLIRRRGGRITLTPEAVRVGGKQPAEQRVASAAGAVACRSRESLLPAAFA
jgi:CRP/FNR family cyclic AMP-dependent transcriptional regulator